MGKKKKYSNTYNTDNSVVTSNTDNSVSTSNSYTNSNNIAHSNNTDNSVVNSKIKTINKAVDKSVALSNMFNGSLSMFNRSLSQSVTNLNNIQNTTNVFQIASANIAQSEPEDTGPALGEQLIQGATVGIDMGKKLMEQADAYESIQIRLDSVNDGQQTSEQLNDQIMASANRMRIPFESAANTVANLGAVAGESFGSTEEMVAFGEIMNKQFKLGGGSAEQQADAVDTLTQAMASGTLSGESLETALGQAPLLAQALADQLNVPTDKLEQMGQQGLITSDLIKQAMFSSAAEAEASFSRLPMTFSDVGTLIQNQVAQNLNPVFEQMMSYLNSDAGMTAIQSIISSFCVLGSIVAWVIMGLVSMSELFANNWSFIEPAVMAAVFALGLFKTAVFTANAITAVKAGLETLAAAKTAFSTGLTLSQVAATKMATGAQIGLNAALLASPLTWVILIIIGIIAAIYMLVAAFNKVTGSTVSATGIILGVIFTAGAMIWNYFAMFAQYIFMIVDSLINYFLAFANFFANVFKDPIGSAVNLFMDLANIVFGILSKMAGAIDGIFGSSLADKVNEWQEKVSGFSSEIIAKFGNGKYKKVADSVDSKAAAEKSGISFDTVNVKDSFMAGYKIGDKFDDKFKAPKADELDYEKFTRDPKLPPNPAVPTIPESPYASSPLNNPDWSNNPSLTINPSLTNNRDFTKNSTLNNTSSQSFNSTQNNNPALNNINNNVGSMKNSMQMSEEDLKYLRDIAEQEIINRFTTAEVKVEQNNKFGDVKETADLDGIMSYLERTVRETIAVTAEGAALYV